MAFGALAWLTLLVLDGDRSGWEGDLLRTAVGAEHPLLEGLVVLLAFLGAGAGLMLLLAATLWHLWTAGRGRDALFVGGALLVCQMLGRVIKNLVQAPRPVLRDQELLSLQADLRSVVLVGVLVVVLAALFTPQRRVAVALAGTFAGCMVLYEFLAPSVLGPDDRAFPSGHATSSMAFAAALVLIARTAAGRRRALIAGAIFVAGVGASRIAMGVHHPSDVLAGWALSLGMTGGVWIAVRAMDLRWRHDDRHAGNCL